MLSVTSKQARKSFPSSAKFRASRPLELIHGDLCGPLAPETLGGSKYFLLLVDDCTRMLWVSLLKQKLEAFKAFKSFKAQAEREKELKLICLRTDNGGEFTSKGFISFCSEHEIQRHFSTPYTPQQNEVVERKNRTILDMTRAMLKNKNLPKVFWGEAVSTAVYLLNRAPTKSLEGKTPYEGWTGRQPSVEHLKVFGCIVFVKTLGKSLRKLDDRSIPMIFIGYEKGVKGYRTFNLVSQTIHITRDVVIKEEKSWNWEEFNQDSLAGMLTSEYSSYVNLDSNNAEMPTVSSSQDSITENSSNFSASPLSSSSSASSQPCKFKELSQLYEETQPMNEEEAFLLSEEEPGNFLQALREKVWKAAMEEEFNQIQKNNTWFLVTPPASCKPIGLKWVFKVKKDSSGQLTKHKARLVVKGYAQRYGIDFTDVFAPVARMETIRVLLALAAVFGWEVHHLDVKSAFLNGEISEEIYVKQPEGYEIPGKEHHVYKLRKALYGLKQAPRAWYSKLDKSLLELGLRAWYSITNLRFTIIQAIYT